MSVRRRTLRRIAVGIARTATGLCAVGLSISIWGASTSGIPHASAATNEGALTVVKPFDGTAEAGQPLNAGGSATPFSFVLPANAACAGDSANDGYRVQSFAVPATVDVNGLTFDAAGPVPSDIGAAFRQPLYTVELSPFVDAQTANATTPGGPGPVINIPGFSLGVYEPGNVPAGTYTLGIACTKGPASATQLDRYWTTQLEILADAADQPSGITWTVVTSSPGTTTTTTTGGDTTTTTAGGSTTTTAGGSTSTTTAGGATTTTTRGGTPTTAQVLASGAAPTATPFTESLSALPMTGGSPGHLLMWSVLLLIFGRMAVLLARPLRVLPPAAA